MKLLADANLERSLVLWLRDPGHDVTWAAEFPPATPDEVMLATARKEGRVLVTNDLDFGELVYRLRLASAGILLLRYRARSSDDVLGLFKAHWHEIEPRLEGHFMVATPDRLRIRPLPEPA